MASLPPEVRVTRSWLPLLLVLPLLASCATRHAWQGRDANLASLAGENPARDCAAGSVEACDTLAAGVEQSGAVTGAVERALYDLYLYGCELGSDDACQQLGYAHVYGARVNDDPWRAQDALVAACERGHGNSCHCAGSTLADGLLGAEDEPAAFALFVAGCELDQAQCCSWTGLMYDFGRGVPQDKHQAYTHFVRGCQLGEAQVGCFNQALHMSNWPEGEQDLDLMIELSIRACDAGNEIGCGNVDVFREWAAPAVVEPDPGKPKTEP
jgi:TPR repeat protein